MQERLNFFSSLMSMLYEKPKDQRARVVVKLDQCACRPHQDTVQPLPQGPALGEESAVWVIVILSQDGQPKRAN